MAEFLRLCKAMQVPGFVGDIPLGVWGPKFSVHDWDVWQRNLDFFVAVVLQWLSGRYILGVQSCTNYRGIVDAPLPGSYPYLSFAHSSGSADSPSGRH